MAEMSKEDLQVECSLGMILSVAYYTVSSTLETNAILQRGKQLAMNSITTHMFWSKCAKCAFQELKINSENIMASNIKYKKHMVKQVKCKEVFKAQETINKKQQFYNNFNG